MRTLTEVLERIAYLDWFKKDLVYHFQVTPMTKQKHAVAAAFYRTLDNEIAMLRWFLGDIENTWSDDTSHYIDLVDVVEKLPPTDFPHLPHKRRPAEYWGVNPVPVCRYFPGPDSPSDDPSFNPANAHDPATWKKQSTPCGSTARFHSS